MLNKFFFRSFCFLKKNFLCEILFSLFYLSAITNIVILYLVYHIIFYHISGQEKNVFVIHNHAYFGQVKKVTRGGSRR